LVVSNPPYVSPAEFAGLPADVLADPEPALDGGSGGIQVHERLARESPAWLRPGGFLVVEIGPRQAERVSALFDERFEEVRVLPDLAGRDRVVVGRMR
jgi:release factor glutamine methyltransferase